MFIPLDWEYKNPSLYKNDSSAPHAFQLYDSPLGRFQLSCRLVTAHLKEIIKTNGLRVQDSDAEQIEFTETVFLNDKFNTYMWMAAVDDHFILATYIFDGKKRGPKNIKLELNNVKGALARMKLIKPQFRKHVAASRRFDLFMTSLSC